MKCGAKLARRCSHCGTEFPEDALFCMKCGNRLVSQADPVDGSQEKIAHEAERRQLTVMFCDLVGSTPLSEQLDPEDLRKVMQAYQETCGKVIHRFEGNIAQYLGDGLLVYFGYPQAHEDDAQRAARTGLGIVEAITRLNPRLNEEWGVELAVRIGIHTGLVVAGEVGDGNSRERLAMGETPNIAARLQNEADPNTVVISAATYRLIEGFFACQQLDTLVLKGFSKPIDVCQLCQESSARSRLDTVVSAGSTPLVGRDQEIGLLFERWEQTEEGMGQVVLLSGEAGVGKSRLVQAMKEHVAQDPQAWLTPCQCSPYHRNSAFYPVLDLLERIVLQFERGDDPAQKLSRLEGFLVQYAIPQPEMVPLFADLLSIPLDDKYTPSNLSPERKKQLIFQTMLGVLLEIADRQPLLLVMEDLHWADPTTLEFLNLLVDQIPTTRIFALFTFRPDFSPPWIGRAHLTNLTLRRLPQKQIVNMIHHVAGGKALPAVVLEQIVKKTDGVPLFVEELTKMVLESGLLREKAEGYELAGPLPPLAIPATLQDSLMARLDRLASVKEIVQLSAILGRELTYEMLQAVSSLDDETLQQGLSRLVEAELLYQRGIPPQATFTFKHALIQETAYQSLLKGTRQQYHQRIAGMLVEAFPETVATKPELVAHHYTEAGLGDQAVAYWQQAGQRALEGSANAEAVSHLIRGLEILMNQPDTPERGRRELALHLALGGPLIATKGYAAPEIARSTTRARELVDQVGDTEQRFPVLYRQWVYHLIRTEYHTARTLGEEFLHHAKREGDPALALMGHRILGVTQLYLGELSTARVHLEQTLALYDAAQHRTLAFRFAQDPQIACQAVLSLVLWLLGYPEQAGRLSHEAIANARALEHINTLAYTLFWGSLLAAFGHKVEAVEQQAQALIALSEEQGLAFWLAYATSLDGWTRTLRGHGEQGLPLIAKGVADMQSTGAADFFRSFLWTLLAEASAEDGQAPEGLRVLDETLAFVDTTGECFWEAEVYRLKGKLILHAECGVQNAERTAAECFQQARGVARRQQAKSLELRAAMSLSRLWQAQGRKEEARSLLSEVYGWFTEGFDTEDLIEAKALLDELS
jgi:predicted ATPase/class 3 adenylate cyclase